MSDLVKEGVYGMIKRCRSDDIELAKIILVRIIQLLVNLR